jgi:hypothetical protein
MNGPLSDVAIEIFTKHLSFLCGQMMVLDPESAGHEMYQHGGRYQWKVEGGRTADHQGVAFKASGDSEIYFIRRNHIDVIVRVPYERGGPTDSERVLANVANVLSPTFKAVLHELMAPYHDPIRDPAP